MSWRQPYRSGLRDLAQSLLQQAETRRVNDAQENQLRLQADAQRAQATQQLFQGLGQAAIAGGQAYQQQQQQQYERGANLRPTVQAEAARAQDLLARAEQVRAENPNAISDGEYAALVQMNDQYTSLMSKPVQDLPDAWREVRGSTFVDKGTPARLFSPEQIASGEAAAALNQPLTGTDILSRGNARLATFESDIADVDAQKETNGQLVNNFLSQMSVIGDANLNLEENPAAPQMAANALVQLEALLDSGAKLPDSINREVIEQQISSTRSVLETPLFAQALSNARANLTAQGAIADAKTLQAELDLIYEPQVRAQDLERGEVDIERARAGVEAANAQVAQLEFANYQAAFEAWRQTGVVPQTTDSQGNPWGDQIRAQYNANPIRQDGRTLSFEEATQYHADRQRARLDNEAQRLEYAVDAAGINVDAAQIELDAAKYAAKYSEFNIDLSQASQVQDYVASAVANGDAQAIASLMENHPEALADAGINAASLERSMERARTSQTIQDASDAARIAELNYAIDNMEVESFAQRQQAMQGVLQEKAAFMSPEALDNWWASLKPEEKSLFGDTPEAQVAMLESAKVDAGRRQFLLQNQDLSVAWERVNALRDLNPDKDSVASFKVRVEDILAPVMSEEDAAAVADAVAVDWANGNEDRALEELKMDLQEQGINATMAAIENGDVVWDADEEAWRPAAPAAGEAAPSEPPWDPKEARLILSERAEQRRSVLQSLEDEARRLGCGEISGFSGNAGRCEELSGEINSARQALESVDEDIARLLSSQTNGSLGEATAEEVRVEADGIAEFLIKEMTSENGALPVDAVGPAITGAAAAAADEYGVTGDAREDYINRVRRQARTQVEAYLEENSVVQTPAAPRAAGAPPPRLDSNASRIVAEYGDEIASGRELVPEFYGQYYGQWGLSGALAQTPFFENASRAVTNAVRGAGNPLEGAGDAFSAAGEAIRGAPGTVGQAAEAARRSVLATTEPGLPENGFLPNTREDAREAFRNVRRETLEQFNPAVATAREAVRGAPRAASRAARAAGQSVRGAPREASRASDAARDSVLSSLGLPTPQANPIGFPETEFSRQFGNAAEAARESIYDSLGIGKDRISPRETNEYTPFLSEDVRPEVNNILPRLIQQESGGRQRTDAGELLESPVGALGKTQLMPETMIQPGYQVEPLVRFTDLPAEVRSEISRRRAMRDALPDKDPGRTAQQNAINDLIRPYVEDIPTSEYVRFAGDYLDAMLEEYDGDMNKALAAYNAGPGRVDDALEDGGDGWLSLLPEETRNYVRNVNR